MWAGSQFSVFEDIANDLNCKENNHQHKSLEGLNNGICTPTFPSFYVAEDNFRYRVLKPFLFFGKYKESMLTAWAITVEFLPIEGFLKDGTINQTSLFHIDLLDTVAIQLSRILRVIEDLSSECQFFLHQLSLLKTLGEEVMNNFHLSEALKRVNDNPIYNIIMKQIRKDATHMLSNLTPESYGAAFCICLSLYYHPKEVINCNSMTLEESFTKEKGNDLFKIQSYPLAIDAYSHIIKTSPNNKIIYSNRAQAYLNQEKWCEAEVDAKRVTILDPTWCKGYYKLVKAFEGQEKFHQGHLIALLGTSRCNKSDPCANFQELDELCTSLSTTCVLKGLCSNKMGTKPETLAYSSLDIPDLMSDSDSDQAIEDAMPVSKPSPVNPHNNKSSSIGDLELFISLKRECGVGSEYLLKNRNFDALGHFEIAMQIFYSIKDPDSVINEREIVALKYALGISYASGNFENLRKSLVYFEDIEKNYNCDKFPALYYGLAFVLLKMFRFDDALEPIKTGLGFIEKNDVLKQYYWPGTDSVIEETIKDKLLGKLNELRSQCRFAPDPDAICRLASCSFTKNIYFSDPNYKTCYQIFCTGNCKVEYHPFCWKSIRDSESKTEKDFLDKLCMTPDCGNIVYLIQILGRNGEVLKVFESTVHNHGKTTKHRKSKLERKTEHRHIKKLKKLEKGKKPSKDDETGDDLENEENELEVETQEIFEDTTTNVNHDSNAVSEKENNSVNTNHPIIYEVNSKPSYIFKKEDSVESDKTDNKPNKSRDKKRVKKNATIGVDEFCRDLPIENLNSNAYLERMHRLQESKEIMEESYIIEETLALSLAEMRKPSPEPLNITPSALEFLNQREDCANVSHRSENPRATPVEGFHSPALKEAKPSNVPHQLSYASREVTSSESDVDTGKLDQAQKVTNTTMPSKSATNDIMDVEHGTLEESKNVAHASRILDIVRKNTTKLTNNFNAAAFQLQVTLLALPDELQLNLVAGILNNIASKSDEFWERLNALTNFELIVGERQSNLKDMESKNSHLKMVNQKLQEDLTNLRDSNVKLHNTNLVIKSSMEQQNHDIQLRYNELAKQAKEQIRNIVFNHDLETKRLQQEKAKMHDDMNAAKKDIENLGNYKQTIQILEMEIKELQTQLESTSEAKDALEFTNSAINSELDENEMKCQNTLGKLIQERRNFGTFTFKKAAEPIEALIFKMSKAVMENPPNIEIQRMEIHRHILADHLSKLNALHKEFQDNIEKCLHSLNASIETFTFDEIPPIPIFPVTPSFGDSAPSRPPGFNFLPSVGPNITGEGLLGVRPALLPNPPLFITRPSSANPFGFHNLNLNLHRPEPLMRTPIVPIAKVETVASSPSPQLQHSSITPIPSSSIDELTPIRSVESPPIKLEIKKTQMVGATAMTAPNSPVHLKPRSPYDRIVALLKQRFSHLSEEDLKTYIKRFRSEREKCSGKTHEQVAELVSNFILDETNMELRRRKPVLRDCSPVPDGSVLSESKPAVKSWKVNSQEGATFHSKDCGICFEPLDKFPLFKAECGHNTFHEKCVKPWLRENSTCPICRRHILLPDDYPNLN